MPRRGSRSSGFAVPEPVGPILLVEDDEPLRHILAVALRARGHVVVDVATAEDATAALTDGLRPSLVLLDLNLPGDTGWDLLRAGSLARAGDPPVVITSAVVVDPRRLAEHGVAGYLPKPFAVETLLATVERLGGGGGADA
jgi:DNA-binding response OmpR family regulator